ncbi:MAG: hypothetical protein U9O91_02440 [Candidatus Caldatribacteriota bacterium]|nr:hypothetical protein [Candidatus Caldatribacteriota bacterium]
MDSHFHGNDRKEKTGLGGGSEKRMDSRVRGNDRRSNGIGRSGNDRKEKTGLMGGNYKETRELDGIPEPLNKVTVLGG